jgi:hypothetical protein
LNLINPLLKLRLLLEGRCSRPPAHLRGAGKVAETRGHQHEVFHGPLDESRVISSQDLAHTYWDPQASAAALAEELPAGHTLVYVAVDGQVRFPTTPLKPYLNAIEPRRSPIETDW